MFTFVEETHSFYCTYSGNAISSDRVRAKWRYMYMTAYQTAYQFRREVEDYQMERVAVGLQPVPNSELVMGILKRVGQERYD